MKTAVSCCLLAFIAACAVPQSHAQGHEPLRLVQMITLPIKGKFAVSGKFDHMAVDPHKNLGFVAASGESKLVVIDLSSGKVIESIPGKGKPAGVAYCAQADRVVYALDSGSLLVLNPNTLKLEHEVPLAKNADSLAWDAADDIVWVDAGGDGGGESFSRLSPVRLKNHTDLGDIKLPSLALEAIAIEKRGSRLFVADKAGAGVFVIDREKRRVIGRWPITIAKQPVSMALNEAEHRLYVGTRKPAMLVVIDTRTGKTVAHYPSTGFVDGAAYDSVRKRIYMSGGYGFLDVFQELDPDRYLRIEKIPTREQARTSRWVPGQNRLYLEVPAIKLGWAGQIRVFEAQ